MCARRIAAYGNAFELFDEADTKAEQIARLF